MTTTKVMTPADGRNVICVDDLRRRLRDTPDTDARIFVARLMRDLRTKEALGAGMLSPGATTWKAAFERLADVLAKANGPVKRAALCRAAQLRLVEAQRQGACFINCRSVRKRSAGFEILGWVVEAHPLIGRGYDGVTVRSYVVAVTRTGLIWRGTSKCAHLSWHALARLWSRSSVDIFAAHGVVALCGIVGLLMSASPKHANTAINVAFEEFVCTGVLRVANGSTEKFCSFDVLTVLESNERTAQKYEQGKAIASAAWSYVHSNNADPAGHVDDIPILPFHETDFVSRELRARIAVG